VRAVRVGTGALAALHEGGEGDVVAWFPKACYVSLPTGLVALVAPDVEAGPVHAELDAALPRVRRGARAGVVDRGLEVDGWRIGLTGGVEWRGPLPPPHDVRASAATILAGASSASASSSLLAEPFGAPAERARRRLLAGSLDDAARLLVGLGPGLTPSGDDALAGVLFALRAAAGEEAEASTRPAAEAGETGPVSRGFLRWAARGQVLAPAHDLLVSAARRDPVEASSAARRMAAVGETSGADFLLGLRWGMEAVAQRSRSSEAHSRS
jgi:Protein of unknown function (DUF2877)